MRSNHDIAPMNEQIQRRIDDLTDALEIIDDSHEYIHSQLTFAIEHDAHLSDDDTDYCDAAASLIADLISLIYDDDRDKLTAAMHALATCASTFRSLFPALGSNCAHDAAIPITIDFLPPSTCPNTDLS